MKTIGFVDYYISEWHANTYPQWIKEICERTGKEYSVRYAWAEKDVSPVDGRNTDEWCRAFGVEKCETLGELCRKSDYILVLAPSNPEKHLEYAKEVLTYGKNTYIDKTFAPDFATAKQIFDIAAQYGTKFFSTSALRYADEIVPLAGSRFVLTFGGGSNLEEYIIHQIEMVVSMIKEKAAYARVENQGNEYLCTVRFEHGARATMIFSPSLGFSVCVTDGEGRSRCEKIRSDYFRHLLADILRFYEEGTVSFDGGQTLEVMKIREAVLRAKEQGGEWVKI